MADHSTLSHALPLVSYLKHKLTKTIFYNMKGEVSNIKGLRKFTNMWTLNSMSKQPINQINKVEIKKSLETNENGDNIPKLMV